MRPHRCEGASLSITTTEDGKIVFVCAKCATVIEATVDLKHGVGQSERDAEALVALALYGDKKGKEASDV